MASGGASAVLFQLVVNVVADKIDNAESSAFHGYNGNIAGGYPQGKRILRPRPLSPALKGWGYKACSAARRKVLASASDFC